MNPTSHSSEHLLVFARYPEVGKTKTRLHTEFTPEAANDIYRYLLAATLERAKEIARERSCRVTICFTGGSESDMRHVGGKDLEYELQIGETLGSRMNHAIKQAYSKGSRRIIVIGTDCIELSVADLRAAFEALSSCDVVLGPASDGGYYLIGLTEPRPDLFDEIDWGTESVLRQTLVRVGAASLNKTLLTVRNDIDHPADLLSLRIADPSALPHLFGPVAGQLSVIIPTYNEEENLPETLMRVEPLQENREVIVVDGGSTDRTRELAEESGCRVISSPPGRGHQMNGGAAIATGENLLFLHADTWLPSDFQQRIEDALKEEIIAGAFRLRIRERGIGYRSIEWGANSRSRWRQLPYGDQAIFISARDFFKAGGYRNWPLMEDYELMHRLRAQGRIKLLDAAVETSARRWQKNGIWSTFIRNQQCILKYHRGEDIERIREFYYGSQH